MDSVIKNRELLKCIDVNMITALNIMGELYGNTPELLKQITLELVARNPSCSKEILEELYSINDFNINLLIIHNPSCPVWILEKASKNSNWRYRFAVASNLNCPANILETLANDKESYVKKAVAKNPNCPSNVLKKLFEYDKESVLKNSNCPKEIIKEYATRINFYNYDNEERLYVISNPNCPKDRINYIYKKILEISKELEKYMASFLTSNHFVTDEENRELDNVRKFEALCDAILGNPNCPKDILIDLYKNDFCSDKLIASNPNCPAWILEELSNCDSFEVKKAIIHNPNCPQNVLVKLSNDENINIKSDILHVIKFISISYVLSNISEKFAYYYIVDLCFDKKFKGEINNHFSSFINNSILSGTFDDELLNYISGKSNLRNVLSDDAIRILNRENTKSKEVGTGQEQMFKNALSDAIIEKNISQMPYFNLEGKMGFEYSMESSDFSKSMYNGNGIRPIIKDSSLKKEDFEYGEYPQDKVCDLDAWALDKLYSLKALEPTGNVYRISTKGILKMTVQYYKEYKVKGRKFVRFNNEWYETKKIKWLYDKDRDCYISEKALFASEMMEKYPIIVKNALNRYFIGDIYNVTTKIKEAKYAEKQEKKSYEDEKEILRKKAIESFKEKEKEEKLREERKILIQRKLKEMLQRMDEISNEMVAMSGEMDDIVVSSMIHRIDVPEEILLINSNDYREFNKDFIPYLKHINLAMLSSTNLKVSGLDFRGTNISINPQKVYNKDLSNASFDDDNISFKDLSGCDLRGANIESDSNCYGYENALIDENTKLPNSKVGEKNEISK